LLSHLMLRLNLELTFLAKKIFFEYLAS
jgi:hypothetical protein